MESVLLIALYGLCSWGAILNFPAWTILFWRRLRMADRPLFHQDAYLLTRMGLTTMSFGVAGLSGVRLLASLIGADHLELPSPIGLVFIGSMALAEPLFLRVDAVHARERGSWSLSWRAYWIGAIAWLLFLGLTVAHWS